MQTWPLLLMVGTWYVGSPESSHFMLIMAIIFLYDPNTYVIKCLSS